MGSIKYMDDSSVAIIVLNYKNANTTIKCVNSILQNVKYRNKMIVIVDNHSNDQSMKKLKIFENVPLVKLLETSKNGGYAYGNNFGIRYALKEGFEYINVINNDIIVDNDYISKLMKNYTENKGIGIIGPRFDFDSDYVAFAGGFQNLFLGRVKTTYKKSLISELPKKLQPCEYISGACMLFPSSIISRVGTLPEYYFLYYEENDWCKKIQEKGYKVFCDLTVSLHHEGKGTVRTIEGLEEYFMCRSRIIFERINATFFQKIVFFPYLFCETFCSILIGHAKFKRFNYYLDGFTGKNKYKKLEE